MDKRKAVFSVDAGLWCDGLGLKLLEQTLKWLGFFISLSVSLAPTSAAIIITSNNPLSAITKTFTPVMWLQ